MGECRGGRPHSNHYWIVFPKYSCVEALARNVTPRAFKKAIKVDNKGKTKQGWCHFQKREQRQGYTWTERRHCGKVGWSRVEERHLNLRRGLGVALNWGSSGSVKSLLKSHKNKPSSQTWDIERQNRTRCASLLLSLLPVLTLSLFPSFFFLCSSFSPSLLLWFAYGFSLKLVSEVMSSLWQSEVVGSLRGGV